MYNGQFAKISGSGIIGILKMANQALNKSNCILVVEDEPKLAALLRDYLLAEGFESHCIDNGSQVLPWVKKNEPELILLDIMLPGKDGLSICREIRSFSQVPIIMLTARIDEIDRLLGLELGADDYICKPFSPREVIARVKAVLRRSGQAKTDFAQSDFVLNNDTFSASYQGQMLELTVVEFRLLGLLVKHPHKVFSREQLLNYIYTDQRIVGERTIDTHIKNLRKKMLAVAPDKEMIHSIYGLGYKLEV